MKSTFVGVRSGVKSEAEKAAGRSVVRLGEAPPYIDSGVHLRVHPRTRSFGRLCVVLCALLASAACSLPLKGTDDVAAYDFGTTAGAHESGPRLRQPLLVYEVSSPAWMDSGSINYRLAYRDASEEPAIRSH